MSEPENDKGLVTLLCDNDVTVDEKPSQDVLATEPSNGITPAAPTSSAPKTVTISAVLPDAPKPFLPEGDTRFGVTATGAPLGLAHWLADSSICGDMVMSLPSSVLIAERTAGGGTAVDMSVFLDAIIEGAAKLEGLAGISSAASLPVWAVSRLFGTFPVLQSVYSEALDQAVLTVEAAAFRAAIGMKAKIKRSFVKSKNTPEGKTTERSQETTEKTLAPDPTLSKLILTSRMKGRYVAEEGVKQAVQINILPAEARL